MRVGRIELPSAPWQGAVIPLNYTRSTCEDYTTILKRINYFVPRTGLEPAYLAAYAPEAYVSTNFTTWAFCAPGGTRTPKNGSEDRCDIHFTTGAASVSYATFASVQQIR